ncbi:MAG: glycosyltransferase family 39 protein [Sphingopyxis sp.]|nr:glycosyltransferase family 39 protein [Sphingopyxis sp.]
MATLAVGAILLIALLLRIDLMLTKPLWLDEIYTGAVTQSPVSDLFARWLSADPHPPLYYLLMDGWTALFGRSNLALRIPSLLASMLMVAFGAMAMARRHGRNVGMMTALALAVPAAAAWQASEARSYALVMLLALLTMIAHWRLSEDASPTRWATLVAVSFATCMTHYFGFLFVACIWTIVLTESWRGRRLKPFVIAALALAAAVTPWLAWHLPYMLSKTGGSFWIPPVPFSAALAKLTLAIWSDSGYLLLFAILPGLLLLWPRARTVGLSGFPLRGYLAVLVVATLTLAIISQFTPLIIDRYLSVFVPMASLIAVNMFAGLAGRRGLPVMIGCAAVALAAQWLSPPFRSLAWLGWEEESHWIAAQHADLLVFAFDDPAGAHIGAANLAKVGGFFLQRSGDPLPVAARTVTSAQPQMDHRMPAGRRVAVLRVEGAFAPSDPDWLDRVRAAHPQHHCTRRRQRGPDACIFDTRP